MYWGKHVDVIYEHNLYCTFEDMQTVIGKQGRKVARGRCKIFSRVKSQWYIAPKWCRPVWSPVFFPGSTKWGRVLCYVPDLFHQNLKLKFVCIALPVSAGKGREAWLQVSLANVAPAWTEGAKHFKWHRSNGSAGSLKPKFIDFYFTSSISITGASV